MAVPPPYLIANEKYAYDIAPTKLTSTYNASRGLTATRAFAIGVLWIRDISTYTGNRLVPKIMMQGFKLKLTFTNPNKRRISGAFYVGINPYSDIYDRIASPELAYDTGAWVADPSHYRDGSVYSYTPNTVYWYGYEGLNYPICCIFMANTIALGSNSATFDGTSVTLNPTAVSGSSDYVKISTTPFSKPLTPQKTYELRITLM